MGALDQALGDRSKTQGARDAKDEEKEQKTLATPNIARTWAG